MQIKPKNILWVTNNWLFDYGGRKIASKKILNFLAEKGFKITVLDFEVREKQINAVKENTGLINKITFHFISLPDNKKIILEIIKFAKSRDFNLIIVSGSAAVDLLTIASIRLFHLFRNSKLILFEHTNPLQGIRLSNFWFMHIFLAKIFYKTLNFIIAPSEHLKKMFINEFKVTPKKVKVLYYPVINNHFPSLIKEKVNEKVFWQKKSKIIITSARLDQRQKDFLTLLKSLEIVNIRVDAILAILGIGPDQKKIEVLANELKIKNKVMFLGFQKNPFKYIAKSDVFVLSSKFEGAPLVLVETMACGTPIVSSDCDFGPREILENGKNGILVPVGDEQKMADSVIKLLKDQNLKKRYIMNGFLIFNKYRVKTSLTKWYNFLLHV